VNLIPYNPHEESPYRAPPQETVDRFRHVLLDGGIQAITGSGGGRTSAPPAASYAQPTGEKEVEGRSCSAYS